MKNTLRVRRAERRLSQMALAAQAGIHHNRLWRIENEHTEPSEDERARIAAVLGCAEALVFMADDHTSVASEAVVATPAA